MAVLVAATCARLGFWQLSRLDDKRKLNAELRAALAAPPRALPPATATPAAESLAVARFEARGRFDESRQFVLMNRSHAGEPGVEIITPFVLEPGGSALLVDRGWVPAPDAMTARPADYPVPAPAVGDSVHTVIGLVSLTPRRGGGPPWRETDETSPAGQAGRAAGSESTRVWTAPWLDADSLAVRLPYDVRPYVLRELPSRGAPRLPARTEAHPYDETMHKSYAAQWFFFGAVALAAPFLLARIRRRPANGAGREGPPLAS